MKSFEYTPKQPSFRIFIGAQLLTLAHDFVLKIWTLQGIKY